MLVLGSLGRARGFKALLEKYLWSEAGWICAEGKMQGSSQLGMELSLRVV